MDAFLNVVDFLYSCLSSFDGYISFIFGFLANDVKEQWWWWMMKCGWCKKIDDSLCCDVLLISRKAFEKFCHFCLVSLLWRSNAFVWSLQINFISILLWRRLLIPKEEGR